jgi:hypothetical protein
MAAGLNTCFFLNAKRYLDAIAIKDAIIANIMLFKLTPGVTISETIRAVIAHDSTFVIALKILEKNMFVMRLTAKIREVVKIKEMELKGRVPKKLINKAKNQITIRKYSNSRYMGIKFRMLSSGLSSLSITT